MVTPVRATLAGALALLLLAGATGCRRSRPAPAPGGDPATLGLTVTASQPSYRPGERVELRIRLTNPHAAGCRLSRVAAGGLSVSSLTRDGAAVPPTIGTAHFYRDFGGYLAENLVTVPPKGSVEFTLPADPQGPAGSALTTAAPDGRGGATLTWWPVDRPGAYRVTLRYLRPPASDLPADPCTTATGAGEVRFEVRG
ncbi:hypothetical protein [Micromonospora auratinigra]|uniref:DUF4232 domain-containing protein n=1 Tax=Micromonospora auratinigra TaxID=261654 RepID=A0A1A8ZH95_9ACTN|nr:hypothetical protein [Micromonospora auratinigra]SBT43197.1 hypothetical protein GA0070611_2239 [Micromonospora auratinigra]